MEIEKSPRFWSQGTEGKFPKRVVLTVNATCNNPVHTGIWNDFSSISVEPDSKGHLEGIMGEQYRRVLSVHEAMDCPATPLVSISTGNTELTNIKPEQRLHLPSG